MDVGALLSIGKLVVLLWSQWLGVAKAIRGPRLDTSSANHALYRDLSALFLVPGCPPYGFLATGTSAETGLLTAGRASGATTLLEDTTDLDVPSKVRGAFESLFGVFLRPTAHTYLSIAFPDNCPGDT